MPRDESRNFTAAEREDHQLGAFGRTQNSGLRRGPGGRTGRVSGRSDAVPAGQLAGAWIEHATFLATAGQTIASGGGALGFDRIAGAPTERRGFRKAAGELGSTGELFAIPVPLTGPMLIAPRIHFTADVTGTATWVRVRRGVETKMVERTGTGDKLVGPVHLPDLRAGVDTVKLYLDLDADGTVEWGQIQCTQWGLASTTTPRGLYFEVVFDDGPIAYWRLAETSGTTAADAMGSYDGTYEGSPTLGVSPVMVDGSGDVAAEFDGADDRVVQSSTDLSFAGTVAFSVECWVEPDGVSGTGHLVGTSSGVASAGATEGYGLLRNGTQFTFQRRDRSAAGAVDSVTGGTAAANTKAHVVGTYDGTTMRLYVDGTEIGSTASSRSIPSLATFRIGSKHEDSGSDSFFADGTLDEVAVYDRALTAAEVLEHYTVGTQGA